MRIALYVVPMAVLVWLAAFFVMPLAVRWEFSAATVDRIPVFGFFLGGALGAAMARSEPVRHFVWFGFGAILLGWFVWLLVVLVVGLGVSIAFEDEAFERAMEPVNTVATWLGYLAAGCMIAVGGCAILYDKSSALLERFRPKRRP